MEISEFVNEAIVMVQCPDALGLVEKIGEISRTHGCTVRRVTAQEGTAHPDRYFIRAVIKSKDKKVTKQDFSEAIRVFAQTHGAGHLALFDTEENYFYPQQGWHVLYDDQPLRGGLLVGRDTHGVDQLLAQWKYGVKHGTSFRNLDFTKIVSNHPDAEYVAKRYGIPFKHIPARKADRKEEEILAEMKDTDFIHANLYYMILTDGFLRSYAGTTGRPIINLHPALNQIHKGLGSHGTMHETGHIVGATVHFVTPTLDFGPPFKQESEDIYGAESESDLRSSGMLLESEVTVKGMQLFADRRIFAYRRKVERL